MTAILRLLAALVLLSPPAAAQTRGECVDGALWWAEGRVAALGPCEAPEEGFFVLACEAGTVTADAPFPVGAEEGAAATATLDVDGRAFPLEGLGATFPLTGVTGLGGAPLPDAALDALAAGRLATLDTEAGPVEIHLTGSAAAIRAMRAACGE